MRSPNGLSGKLKAIIISVLIVVTVLSNILLITEVHAWGTTVTIYAELNTARVGRDNVYDYSWSSVHDSLTGTVVASVLQSQEISVIYTGVYYLLNRGFLLFDTSVIPYGSTISAVTLNFSATGSTSGTVRLGAKKGTQSNSISTSDLHSFTGSGYGYSDYVTSTVNASYQIAFNAQGISDLVKGGFTKICLMEYDHDLLDSAPSGTNGLIMWGARESVALAQRPFITVTYTPPTTVGNMLFDFGTASSPVQSGWTKITGTTTYSSGTGYGWSSGVTSTDVGTGYGSYLNMSRDYNGYSAGSGNVRSFLVSVSNNGTWNVGMWMYDDANSHNGSYVYANGVQIENNINLTASVAKELNFSVCSTNGVLNFTFGSVDDLWLICGLQITYVTSFFDEFETLASWTTCNDTPRVVNGLYSLNLSAPISVNPVSGNLFSGRLQNGSAVNSMPSIYYSAPTFGNGTIEFDLKTPPRYEYGEIYYSFRLAVAFRMQDNEHYYAFLMQWGDTYGTPNSNAWYWGFYKANWTDADHTMYEAIGLSGIPPPMSCGETYHVTIIVNGTDFTAYIPAQVGEAVYSYKVNGSDSTWSQGAWGGVGLYCMYISKFVQISNFAYSAKVAYPHTLMSTELFDDVKLQVNATYADWYSSDFVWDYSLDPTVRDNVVDFMDIYLEQVQIYTGIDFTTNLLGNNTNPLGNKIIIYIKVGSLGAFATVQSHDDTGYSWLPVYSVDVPIIGGETDLFSYSVTTLLQEVNIEGYLAYDFLAHETMNVINAFTSCNVPDGWMADGVYPYKSPLAFETHITPMVMAGEAMGGELGSQMIEIAYSELCSAIQKSADTGVAFIYQMEYHFPDALKAIERSFQDDYMCLKMTIYGYDSYPIVTDYNLVAAYFESYYNVACNVTDLPWEYITYIIAGQNNETLRATITDILWHIGSAQKMLLEYIDAGGVHATAWNSTMNEAMEYWRKGYYSEANLLMITVYNSLHDLGYTSLDALGVCPIFPPIGSFALPYPSIFPNTVEPVLDYTFGDSCFDSNDKYVFDSSIYHNDGICTTSTKPTITLGIDSVGAYFDGENNYIITPHTSSFQFSPLFSICFWMRPDSVGDIKTILVKYGEYWVYFEGGKLKCVIGVAGSTEYGVTVTSNSTINLGQWYYVAITYNATTLSMYLDGALDGVAYGIVSPAYTNNMTIGMVGFNGQLYYYEGMLCKLQMYRRAVTLQEVLMLAARQVSSPVTIWKDSQAGDVGYINNNPELPYANGTVVAGSTIRTMQYIAGFEHFHSLVTLNQTGHMEVLDDNCFKWIFNTYKYGEYQRGYEVTVHLNYTYHPISPSLYAWVDFYYIDSNNYEGLVKSILVDVYPHTGGAVNSTWQVHIDAYFHVNLKQFCVVVTSTIRPQSSLVSTANHTTYDPAGTYAWEEFYDLKDADGNARTLQWFDATVKVENIIHADYDVADPILLKVQAHQAIDWMAVLAVLFIAVATVVTYGTAPIWATMFCVAAGAYFTLRVLASAGVGWAQDIVGWTQNTMQGVVDAIAKAMQPLANWIVQAFSGAWAIFAGAIDNLVFALSGGKISGGFTNLINNFVKIIISVINNAASWFQTIVSQITNIATLITHSFIILADFIGYAFGSIAWFMTNVLGVILAVPTFFYALITGGTWTIPFTTRTFSFAYISAIYPAISVIASVSFAVLFLNWFFDDGFKGIPSKARSIFNFFPSLFYALYGLVEWVRSIIYFVWRLVKGLIPTMGG